MGASRDDDDELEEISDLMDEELGISSNKQDVSARTKFTMFLNKHISKEKTFSTLTIEDVTKDLIGKFCAFLLNDAIGWQTSMNYLSSIRRQLEEKLHVTIFKSEAEWYKRSRRNLCKKYVLWSISTGKKLKEQAPPMTMNDLVLLGRALFQKNEKTSLCDRTLLNQQWVSIGRSSDVGSIGFGDLRWMDTYLVIDLTRMKIRKQHSISVFCSSGHWAIDPFHSLACQMLCDKYDTSDRLFSQVNEACTEKRVAAYINRLLKSVSSYVQGGGLTSNLQSQSTRRGSAVQAASNANVNLADIAHRGQWTLDSLSTLFEYVCETNVNDHKIAKVLGGWSDPNHAGLPPSFDEFLRASPIETQDNVNRFIDLLFQQYFGKLRVRSCAAMFTATLLMYLDETWAFQPSHVVHDALIDVGMCAELHVKIYVSRSYIDIYCYYRLSSCYSF